MKLWQQPRATRVHVQTRLEQLKGNINEGKDRIYRATNALAEAQAYTEQQEKELKKLLDAYELS